MGKFNFFEVRSDAAGGDSSDLGVWKEAGTSLHTIQQVEIVYHIVAGTKRR